MKLPDLPDPDEPKDYSIPRDLGESLWFGWTSERWLHDDAGHLPVVSIYDGQYGCEKEFYVDCGGPILDTRKRRPYSFVDSDGETFTLPRTKVGNPPPENQYLAFLSLLESHSYDRKYASRVKSDWYASYQTSSQLAEKLAFFLVTYGGDYLFPDREISIGALVWAASSAGIIIEDHPYDDLQTAVKYGWKSEEVFFLLQNTWLDMPLDAHAKQPSRNPVDQEIINSYSTVSEFGKRKPPKNRPSVRAAKSVQVIKKNNMSEKIKKINALKADSTEANRRRNYRINEADGATVNNLILLFAKIPKSRKRQEIGCNRWALVMADTTGWAISGNEIQSVAEKLGLREASKVMAPAGWLDGAKIQKAMAKLAQQETQTTA